MPEQHAEPANAPKRCVSILSSVIAFAALTGMGGSEFVAKMWSDMDLDIERVKVSKYLIVTDWKRHVGLPKADASRQFARDPVSVRILKFRWTSSV